MADNRHDITMPARLGAQNAEAILGVVIGDALDEARQNFLGRCFWLRLHVDGRIIRCGAARAKSRAYRSRQTRC